MTKGQGWIIIAELGVLLWALYQAYQTASTEAAQLSNSPLGQISQGLGNLFSNL